jgi:hypothetical protein
VYEVTSVRGGDPWKDNNDEVGTPLIPCCGEVMYETGGGEVVPACEYMAEESDGHRACLGGLLLNAVGVATGLVFRRLYCLRL